jgi:hypothetical protein
MAVPPTMAMRMLEDLGPATTLAVRIKARVAESKLGRATEAIVTVGTEIGR